jgi:hopanoid biosynthesis associated RND transporter like protein HpnN
MAMRKKILLKIADLAAGKPGLLFIIVILITIIAAGISSRLKLTMHFKNLMPQNEPIVQEFNQIIDEYSTASMIIIAARGKEQELKHFADDIVPKIKDMKKYVQRVDYKLDRNFFLKHGFMLQKVDDLKNTKDIYKNLSLTPLIGNLNNNFEKEYVQDEESISTKEKENNAILFLDGIKYWLETVKQYITKGAALKPIVAKTAVDRFLIGDEYIISQDKDMLLIFAQPTFTINDIAKVVEAENTIDELINRVSEKYPSISAGTTGTIALARDEMVSSSKDMHITSIIAFILILVLFIVSFRMWISPILAGISLMIGIIWTAGFAALTVGSLNIMTSMFSVVLIGLGVDFSIHVISVYTEGRSAGLTNREALRQMLLKSGNGIVIGALTTACAFLTLTVSNSAGMSEFGIVAGSGVIFCMFSTLVSLPAMLSLRDKILTKFRKEKYKTTYTEFSFLGKIAEKIHRKPIRILLISFVVTGILLYFALNIKFDYNYLNMEPVGLMSIKLQDEMIEEFDITPDSALITVETVEEARRITAAAKDLDMIGMVTSISNYVPSKEEQKKRVPYINKIRKYLIENRNLILITKNNSGQFIEELERLEANIIEFAQLAYLGGQDKVDQKCKEIIGDLENPENQTTIALLIERFNSNRSNSINNLNLFQKHYEPYFRQVSLGMTSTEPIEVKNLPINIYNQFANKRGNKYLVTIYPKQQVWNIKFLKQFTGQMGKLDKRVTGLPIVFYYLMEIIAKDGRIATLLTIIVIFLLLFFDFGNVRVALTAMIPIVVGSIWMVGTMKLLGLQLTVMNIMGIPLILGIGIDDGVHIIHRYRIEGLGSIKIVFTSTGKAVLLTSLTTMLAFGSLKFATYRGLGSLGIALFIGVGMCFLASVIILPALLGLMEKK